MANTESSSDRRRLPRAPASSSARILRESDAMRLGIDARIKEASVEGLGLLVHEELAVGEHIAIIVRNLVQRFHKKTRGTVRHVTPEAPGVWYAGIELFVRFTPVELSMLRMGMRRDDDDEEIWV